MKRLISLFAMFACMAVGFAQSSLVATLNHGESVSVYYGYDALAEAYEAATHGDLITLSPGMFKSVDIAKNITVRGAGAGATDDCTRLDGSFNIIGVPDSIDGDGHLTLEGLYNDDYISYGEMNYNLPVKNALFVKCRLNTIKSYNASSKLFNAILIQCKITEVLGVSNEGEKVTCFNSYIRRVCTSNNENSNYAFNNCLIEGYPYDWSNSLFTNCILWPSYTGNPIVRSCQAFNCLGLYNSENLDLFKWLYPYNQYESIKDDNVSTIFKTFTGTYSDTETFELTDEAKAKYVGTDGREVGIYGGNFPFTFKSDLPKITKFNVASQSTEDGKLKVEIEVSGVE